MKPQLLLIAMLFGSFFTSSAQKKTIYYFVDTAAHEPKIEIGTEAEVLTYYHFSYKIYSDSQRDLTFTYRNDRNKSKVMHAKPPHDFSSFENLVKLIRNCSEGEEEFNKKYDIYFIEALPNNKFIANSVKMVPNRIYLIQ